MRWKWLVVATALVLLAAACGGDDGGDDGAVRATSTTAASRPDPLGADPLPASGAIPPGSYVANGMTPALRLDIPAGWESEVVATRAFTLTSDAASLTVIQRSELVEELLEMMTGDGELSAGPVSDTTLSRVPAKRFDAVSPGVEILEGDHEVPAGVKVRITVADVGAGRIIAIVEAPESSFDEAEPDATAIVDSIAFA